MIDNRARTGTYIITVRRNGKIFRQDVVHNIITNAALNEEIGIYAGTAPDLQIKYMAFGTGNSSPVATQTTLDSESGRIAVTTSTAVGGNGIITTGFRLTTADLNGVDIEEVGVFCGSGATASADSGTMMSRILWSFSKTSSDEIDIVRTDTIANA